MRAITNTYYYDYFQDSGISEGEGDCSSPQPGHFTNVYLDRLQQKTAVMTTRNDLIEEDIEGDLFSDYHRLNINSEPLLSFEWLT